MLHVEHNWQMNAEIAVLLWLVVIGPLVDIPLTRHLKQSQHPHRRIAVYVATIAALTLTTFSLWPSRQESLLQSPFGPAPQGLRLFAWALVAALALNTVQVGLLVRKSDENRRAVHQAFAGLGFFLPSTPSERRWFVLVALAAGFFEEILFRSFVVRFFNWLPLWGAGLLSCGLFAVGHLYQGWKSALGTFVMAAIFSVIVAGTETLVVAMILHALWDLRVLLFTLPAGHRLLGTEDDIQAST